MWGERAERPFTKSPEPPFVDACRFAVTVNVATGLLAMKYRFGHKFLMTAANLTRVVWVRRRVVLCGVFAGVGLSLFSVLAEKRVFAATATIGFRIESCEKCDHAKLHCDGPELPRGEVFCTCK